MSYWVFENWTHRRARIHDAQCVHCNDGRGLHGGGSGRNDRWHGPFEERSRAFLFADKLNRDDTKKCGTCSP